MTELSRPRRRSRIAHFKAPFVVAVLAPAAGLGVGCGARAEQGTELTLRDGDSTGTTSQDDAVPPPAPGTCPVEKPSVGSACSSPELNCSYGGYYCTLDVKCQAGVWVSFLAASCNPPWFGGPTCPAEQPEAGTSCSNYRPGVTCDYEFCYGTAPLVRCNESSLLWERLPTSTCNPPAYGACPEQMPQHGADCTGHGQVCGYPGCEGPESSTATCTFGQWVTQYSIGPACNPPAVPTPVCPDVEPAAGNGCAFDGQRCTYGACGLELLPRVVSCLSGAWQEEPVSCLGSADAGVDAGG